MPGQLFAPECIGVLPTFSISCSIQGTALLAQKLVLTFVQVSAIMWAGTLSSRLARAGKCFGVERLVSETGHKTTKTTRSPDTCSLADCCSLAIYVHSQPRGQRNPGLGRGTRRQGRLPQSRGDTEEHDLTQRRKGAKDEHRLKNGILFCRRT